MPRIPGALRLTFALYRSAVLTVPDLAVRVAAARACADDRRILSNRAVRAGLAETFRDGLHAGVEGCVVDMQLFSRPWGLDLSNGGRSRVWIGTRDGNVPEAAAIKLAQVLGSELTRQTDLGHFWIAEDDHDVWAWLREA